MGLPWIPVHTNLPGHPKAIALGLALKNKRAWTHLVQLWLWAGEHCPTGRVSARSAEALVEHAAGWEGEAGAFFAAASEVGWLDRDADGAVTLHDWDEHNAAHVEKRERDAARQRARRGGHGATKRGHKRDTSVTEGGRAATVAGEKEKEREKEIEKETYVRTSPPVGVPVLPEKPEKPDDAWDGMDFWAWAQAKRREAGLQPERRPNERTVSVWWSQAHMQGATPKALRRAFIAFGNDPFWTAKDKKPPVPFGGFLSQWERFVEPGVTHAAG